MYAERAVCQQTTCKAYGEIAASFTLKNHKFNGRCTHGVHFLTVGLSEVNADATLTHVTTVGGQREIVN